MTNLLVFGEALIDLKAKSALEFEADAPLQFEGFVGGSPLNVALAAARLGVPSALATRVSYDFFGQEIMGLLERNAVQTDFLERGSEPSTLAFVRIENGHPNYSFRFAGTSFLEYQGTVLPKDLKAVHIGSIFVLFPELATRTFAALNGFTGLIHYDINVRPAIEPNADKYRTALPPAFERSDWVKCSREDFEFLYPNTSETEFAASILEQAAVLVVTDGKEGARLYRKNQAVLEVKTPKVEVVDTVGAGDTFSGASIQQLLSKELLNRAALEQASHQMLIEVIEFAAKAAALNCTKAGCYPPTLEEMQ
jgi:fructokinase